jgi:hypothetical protein
LDCDAAAVGAEELDGRTLRPRRLRRLRGSPLKVSRTVGVSRVRDIEVMKNR